MFAEFAINRTTVDVFTVWLERQVINGVDQAFTLCLRVYRRTQEQELSAVAAVYLT